jgi:hypothetical protein
VVRREVEASRGDLRETDDIELCWICGQLARAHHEAPWDTCEERLRAGWLQVRGNSRMEWDEAGPLTRRGRGSQA